MRSLRRKFTLVLTVAVCATAAAATAQPGPPDDPAVPKKGTQHLLIPAYFFPKLVPANGSEPRETNWERMCRRLRTSLASAIIVMNPSDGKFSKPRDEYTAALRACRLRGQRVIGYVTTANRKGERRRLKAVKTNVDRYYDLYPGVRGIFFDEMRNKTGNRTYYKKLYAHVKSYSKRDVVVGNPGVAAETEWQLETPVVDILVVFEGPTARVEHSANVNGDPLSVNGYDAFAPRDWMRKYKEKHFAHLVYRATRPPPPAPAAGAPTITSICKASADPTATAQRRAKYVYVTWDNYILPDAERRADLGFEPGPPIDPEHKNPWDIAPERKLIACPTLYRPDVIDD